MLQMTVNNESKVDLDFQDEKLSEAVRTLQPVVFKEDNVFCCVLGPDKHDGVFGQGDTIAKALLDWEAHLRKRIVYPKKHDEVAQFIIDKLNVRKEDVG